MNFSVMRFPGNSRNITSEISRVFMGHDPHTKIPFRSQDCSWVSKPGHCEDNGHRINSRFTLHKGDSSSVSRSIRTQRKTSDTGYNVHGYSVHIIQSYVEILDSPNTSSDIRGNISKPFTRQTFAIETYHTIHLMGCLYKTGHEEDGTMSSHDA